MRRSSWLLVPALVLASACNKGGDKAADTPASGHDLGRGTVHVRRRS